MKSLTILKLGTTAENTIARLGDCDHWIARTIGTLPLPVRVIDILGGEALPGNA